MQEGASEPIQNVIDKMVVHGLTCIDAEGIAHGLARSVCIATSIIAILNAGRRARFSHALTQPFTAGQPAIQAGNGTIIDLGRGVKNSAAPMWCVCRGGRELVSRAHRSRHRGVVSKRRRNKYWRAGAFNHVLRRGVPGMGSPAELLPKGRANSAWSQ